MLKRVSKSLYNRAPGNELLIKFITNIDYINTLGCFTNKGIDNLHNLVYSDPYTQEFILNILSSMNELFLQEQVTLEDMSYYVSQLYRPLQEDPTLRQTYINIMPKYDQNILKTYGAIFIEIMIFKSLIPHLLNEHVAYKTMTSEMEDEAIKRQRKEYLDRILGREDEGEKNEG